MIKRTDPEEMFIREAGSFDVASIYEKLVHASASFMLNLPFGLFLEKRYDKVSLRRGKQPLTPAFEVDLPVPGHAHIQEIGREVIAEEIIRTEKAGIETLPGTALLDYERLSFPLKIRNFRPGDRFQPLGVRGTQKLKKFFIDHKIPNFERPKIPLIVSGEMIAWVVGHRIDERVKVTEETRRVLKIDVVQTMKPNADPQPH